MTDFRALCAELLQPLAEIAAADPHHAYLDLVTRARAALSKPAPPSLKEQALARLAALESDEPRYKAEIADIRRALEQLDD